MSAGSVALVVIDDTISMWDMYELGIATAVFGVAHTDLANPWYDLRLCGPRPGTSSSVPGFTLNAPYGLDELEKVDTVIVPVVPESYMRGDRALPEELIGALQRAGARGARMVSLCNGVFALAAAGLLDGRPATAHWEHTRELAEWYPQVKVDDSVLYVDDGDVLTSAGLSGGLDLCLHIVRRDLGARVANQLARRLVVPAHRPGGQAQFVERPVTVTTDDGIAPVLHWALERLDRPLTVDDLATRAGMSVRSFHRNLRAATGTSPMKWLLHQRLARAQLLLETTDLPIDQIGERSGLGSANNLRHHFAGHLGVTPTEYRRAFGET
ncbi:Transcriptional regulator GlxA family, contains an amidase domain and an AraC-type DNA-binding HTH domain [Nonomuraea solani]|uniref:Transcriptional regulator GlxA family, contains an amidase domain and an AraC-type DNA-binding HTH domain n=1 Tax=Nonomuraea solani TaxID=1144553 RepID=A0A1H6EZ66_9ACTN|nr:helix-turn-helix domain-containing protein [Nonomuraea solani]SEH02663.1 Transcriptional regulator GlxA family, contains an amidase domain and an AraC-type DNA-binding HTH domain [Nonomuraea solani]